jgi:zinc metalloprotease ZmpB
VPVADRATTQLSLDFGPRLLLTLVARKEAIVATGGSGGGRRRQQDRDNGEALRLVPDVGERKEEGVLREFTDPAGTQWRGDTPRAAIERFVAERAGDMKTRGADLREVDASEGAGTLRVRYRQYHNDLPVVGATLQAVASLETASVVRVSNTADPDLAGAPSPGEARSIDDLSDVVLAPFADDFSSAEIIESQPAYVRDTERPPLPEADYPTASVALLSTGTAPDGQVHLVHDAKVQTADPFEVFRVVVDAVAGTLLWVELLGKYVTANLRAFVPDPVSESNDATLHGGSTAATLDGFRHDVQAEVDAANNGTSRLQGDWFRCNDWDTPTFAQPAETSANFNYQTYPADRRFLSANAYYWLDTFARYLRGFGNTTLNGTMVRVDVDAQAFNGADQSEWQGFVTPPRIRFGEGGAPDASDMGVIIHEYVHGVFDFLGSNHGGSGSYEHSVCDALPAIWRDRFNANQHRRTETFPFDNNATDQWSTQRTLDRVERFDATNFNTFGANLRNSMLGTALWQCYLGMGGDSTDPAVRQRAADAMIRTMVEMLLITPDDTSTDVTHARRMAQDCIVADGQLTGGLYSKVMDEAFINRGLWARRAVDLYITDSPGDTGAIPSPIPHWTSPDIWVRNVDIADGDDPEQGHQPPINGQANYMYVRVRNRGTQAAAAGAFQVQAYRCDPGTGMIWPTHFQSLGTLTINDPIPAGGAVRVGPFVWTPQIVDHECLLAIVHGSADPATTATLTGTVPHDQLVRFDNNVGQRNVAPQMSVPGGKTKMKVTLHGDLKQSTNTLMLDATAMPGDTKITARTLNRIIDAATLTDIQRTSTGSVHSTLTMNGGDTGVVAGFPLQARDRVSVDLTIDFSHTADHLATYPLVVTQVREGVVVGRLTVQIVAVKELEDFFFANPRSREVHITDCPFWPALGPGSKVPYARLEDALARGYNGCAFCLPSNDTG